MSEAREGTAPETAPAGAPRRPERRLGPRPLPLHLTAAALAWTTSLGALPLLRQDSLPWRSGLEKSAAALRARLAASDPDVFAGVLSARIRLRAMALLDGILAYRRHPYVREATPAPVVWSDGSTRLLDYGALPDSPPGAKAERRKTGAEIPVLFVPSLVNRAYILDLTAETSLLRWLAGQGVRPYLVDWGRPGPDERGFTLTDYIAGRLEGALDALIASGAHGGGQAARPIVVGYCMGGLLALSLALRRQEDLAGLVLMATPWDFHADPGHKAAAARAVAAAMSPALDTLGELPVDVVQALFASLDPLQVARKFIGFSRLDPASRKATLFVALEDWLNDGVPLTAPVARECLLGWYGENTPAAGRWRVAGRPVDPGALAMPCLNLVPAHDRIVPPVSAAALGDAIPGAVQLQPAIGHIGMVVSRAARARIWSPMAEWLLARGGKAERRGKVKKS